MPSRANRQSDLAAVTASNPVLDMDNVYLSNQGWALRHYKREDKSLYWDEILVAGEVPSGDTPDAFGAASPTFENVGGDGTQSPDVVATTGAIFGSGAFTTTTTFTETDGATVAVTFSAPSGGGTTAIGTAVTGGGDMVGYSLSNIGDGYAVGETVTVTEDGGAGVATFEINAVS